MSCAEFRRLLVEDLLAEDPAAARDRLATHAAECTACAEVKRSHDSLATAVADWKQSTAAPPSELGTKIRAALEREAESAPAVIERGRDLASRPRWRAAAWLAAAAALAMVALGLPTLVARYQEPKVVSTAGRLLLAEALAAAEAAEREHARAIAQLEQAAAPVLRLANDPATPARDAAVLLAYRDRLASLDAAIDEVTRYLDENPGWTSARTVLLAAYIDKTELLREVVAWNLQRGA